MLINVKAIGVDGNLKGFTLDLKYHNFSFEHFIGNITRINRKDFGCIDVYTNTIEIVIK